MSPAALAAARDVAEKVTTALGGRGIFGVELFVKGDDVYFSEVSPRPHDTRSVTRARSGSPSSNCTPARSSACRRHHARRTRRVRGDLRRCRSGRRGVRGRRRRAGGTETDLRLFGKPRRSPVADGGRGVHRPDVDTARERAREAASRCASSYRSERARVSTGVLVCSGW